jgi:hypothetical protein
VACGQPLGLDCFCVNKNIEPKEEIMTETKKLAQKRLTLLQLAEKLGNVSKACQLHKFHEARSTGPLEGTNNKIKTIQKQAHGFRDMECFKLKIYALHETKYALIG